MKWTDKVVVVTGACGGIGHGIVERFHADGARVVAVDLADAGLHEQWSADERITAVAADVADQGDVTELVTGVMRTHGHVDALVNAAGVYRDGPVFEFSHEMFEMVMHVNVTGTYLPSQAFGRAMSEQGAGAIVNLASTAAYASTERNPAYSASKGAIVALTRAMAVALAPYSVRVNAIAPGVIDTPMSRAAFADPDYSERMISRILLRRWGQPADIAGSASFLAGDDADFITGTTLLVDGGTLSLR